MMGQDTPKANILRDSLIVGFAMFAVFFGAGNLIFPPQIGFDAGTGWRLALFGLLLTGMLLPVLTVISLGLRGGSVEKLTAPIAPWFGSVLLFVSLIVLAWLIAVPRTASVAFETGFRTLAPSIDAGMAGRVFIPMFFIASTWFALDESNVIDRIGRILTPLLLAFLGVIVLWSVFAPLGAPVPTAETSPFRMGLLTGYQTGDVFGGLMFGILFIEALRARGYSQGGSYRRVLLGASFVTFLGLFFVYGGLEYLGATGSGTLAEGVSQSALLTSLVAQLAGSFGANVLAVAVLLACLTTAVGATAVLGQYIVKWTGGRLSYRAGVVIVSVTSMFQAFGGVDYIVALAGPLFQLLYPVGIAIAVLGVIPPRYCNDGVWKGAAAMALLMGVFDFALTLAGQFGSALEPGLSAVHHALPLSQFGFAWLLPTVAGGLGGAALWRAYPGTETSAAE